jgi:hypothetical protein
MPEQKPDQHHPGAASATRGPVKLSRDHLQKTTGALDLRHVPPPDAELHPARTSEKPR